MSLLLKLFGSTRLIRFDAEMPDGRVFTGKITAEVLNCSKSDIEKQLVEAIAVEKGERPIKVTITAMI